MKRQEILSTAGELIDGERDRVYGSAKENFTTIGKLWEPIAHVELSPVQVALMMNQLKVARLINTPDHPDSWVDAAGYIALGGEIATDAPEPTPTGIRALPSLVAAPNFDDGVITPAAA